MKINNRDPNLVYWPNFKKDESKPDDEQMQTHWAGIQLKNLRERKKLFKGAAMSYQTQQRKLTNKDFFKFPHEENWRMCDQKVKEI